MSKPERSTRYILALDRDEGGRIEEATVVMIDERFAEPLVYKLTRDLFLDAEHAADALINLGTKMTLASTP